MIDRRKGKNPMLHNENFSNGTVVALLIIYTCVALSVLKDMGAFN